MTAPGPDRSGAQAATPAGGAATAPAWAPAWAPAVVRPGASGRPPGRPVPSGRAGGLAGIVRGSLDGTPGRLRLLAAAVVLLCLVFGVAAGQAFRSADGALRRASDNTAQLVRVQTIYTALVSADADATNGFLKGGLESSSGHAQYTAAVGQVSQLIAAAAAHQPADGPVLGRLNVAVQDYTSQIALARANNRQGLPIGAQYLTQASSGLRAGAIPLLDALVSTNQHRVGVELDNVHRAYLWLLVAGIVALLVLLGGMVWLARRTRRVFNLPLVGATLAVLLTLVVGLVGLAGIARQVDGVRAGSYAATVAIAQARTAAFDAKSNESLTLIARGSGQAFELAWQTSAATVTRELGVLSRIGPGADLPPWSAYAAVHAQVRRLDDGGSWDAAVKKATDTTGQSSNATFAAFDSRSEALLRTFSGQTIHSLGSAGGWLPFAGVVGVLAGLLAALLAWLGVSARLQEYR